MRRSERGNILFMILIAVALFAALSYAVTSSSRGGSKGIGEERARLLASRIVQYGTSIEQAVINVPQPTRECPGLIICIMTRDLEYS